MTYIGDKKYWDEKFSSRGDSILAPDDALLRHIHLLKKGSVLDIACGDGRNALFLLENKFKVTGLDYSQEGLKRLKYFADKLKYDVETCQRDLRKVDAFLGLEVYDNIVINHYKLKKELIDELSSKLVNGGILYVSGFSKKHPIDEKIQEKDLIDISDFDSLNDKMTLIESHEYEDNRGCFVTYVFKKQ